MAKSAVVFVANGCEPVEVTGTATPANLAKFEPLADAVAERIKAGRK